MASICLGLNVLKQMLQLLKLRLFSLMTQENSHNKVKFLHWRWIYLPKQLFLRSLRHHALRGATNDNDINSSIYINDTGDKKKNMTITIEIMTMVLTIMVVMVVVLEGWKDCRVIYIVLGLDYYERHCALKR